jgi:hypothetical protein
MGTGEPGIGELQSDRLVRTLPQGEVVLKRVRAIPTNPKLPFETEGPLRSTGEQQSGQPVTTDEQDGPEPFRRRLNPDQQTSPRLPYETEEALGSTAGSVPSADQERLKKLADEAKQLGVTRDRTEADIPHAGGANNPSEQTT